MFHMQFNAEYNIGVSFPLSAKEQLLFTGGQTFFEVNFFTIKKKLFLLLLLLSIILLLLLLSIISVNNQSILEYHLVF